MNNEFNVILNDEYVYGFLPDLIEVLINQKKCAKENGDSDEMLEVFDEAISDAEDQLTEDDDYYIYCMWYNPMGAFVFDRYVREA